MPGKFRALPMHLILALNLSILKLKALSNLQENAMNGERSGGYNQTYSLFMKTVNCQL